MVVFDGLGILIFESLGSVYFSGGLVLLFYILEV